MPNRAAVPAALTFDWVAGKYLNFAGGRSLGTPVALACTGRHGAVRRDVLQGCIKRRVGFVATTRGQRCGTWLELAAPIAGFDGWEDSKELMRSMFGLNRRGRWVEAAFAKRLVAGQIAAFPWGKRLKEFAIGTGHVGPQNEFTI